MPSAKQVGTALRITIMTMVKKFEQCQCMQMTCRSMFQGKSWGLPLKHSTESGHHHIFHLLACPINQHLSPQPASNAAKVSTKYYHPESVTCMSV